MSLDTFTAARIALYDADSAVIAIQIEGEMYDGQLAEARDEQRKAQREYIKALEGAQS